MRGTENQRLNAHLAKLARAGAKLRGDVAGALDSGYINPTPRESTWTGTPTGPGNPPWKV